MPKLPISIPQKELEDFCLRWKIQELALFGSVLRPDFRSDSDIDLLVTFRPDAAWSLFDRVDMIDELQKLFGRKVDFVNKRGIEQSRNIFRKKEILQTAEIIYAKA